MVLLSGERKEILQSRTSISHEPALKVYEGIRFEVPALMIESLVSRVRPVTVIGDIQDHDELPFFDIYKKVDIRTIVVAGLFRDNSLIGALISAFSQQPKTLLDDEAALLKGLANQASSAIEIVSTSRISPTRITLGACRSAARRARAKVCVSAPTSR